MSWVGFIETLSVCVCVRGWKAFVSEYRSLLTRATSESRGTDSCLCGRSLLSFLHFIMQPLLLYHVATTSYLARLIMSRSNPQGECSNECMSVCLYVYKSTCATYCIHHATTGFFLARNEAEVGADFGLFHRGIPSGNL